MTDNVQKSVFRNGLTLVTEQMTSVRSVSVGIWLRTGSRQERESENGISHFIEHMLFKGTATRSAEQIARAADSVGGQLDAFTAKESTCFSIKVLDEHLPRAFDVLADLVSNPRFDSADIDKERQVIREEIKMVEDVPDDLVHEMFTQAYWRGHALGRPILGTHQSVGRFMRRALNAYFRRYYAPGNLIIAAAGNISHRNFKALVSKYFKSSAGSPVAASRPPVAIPHITIKGKKDLEQAHICIGAPGFHQTHARRFPAYIMNSVLGGGMSSRLFQNIREQRGLAYAIASGLSSFHDVGCLNIYAGTATEKAREVVELIVEELRRLKETLLTPEELRHAKDHLKGSLLLSLESTMSRMSHLARQEAYFGRHVTIDEISRGIESVTPEQVRDVSRELISGENLALTILSPSEKIKITRADLAC